MVSRFTDDRMLPTEKDPALVLFEELKSKISQQDFETWLEGTPCQFYPPDRFVFTTQNRFRKAWMEKNFRDLARTCARAIFELEVQIEFEVGGACLSSVASAANAVPELPGRMRNRPLRSPGGVSVAQAFGGAPDNSAVGVEATSLTARDAPRPVSRRDLNPDYLFDTFVVGQSNSVSQAAAIAVCDDPAGSYNPLFIYGDSGTGKTHLLHAICHRLLECCQLRITYLSSEEFLNEFIESLADSRSSSFHTRCFDTDVLVLDDIHFLSGKERTQDELFKLFNAFLEQRKQIIFASRTSPRETPGLQGRLASRFQSGLLTRLDSPNFELRVAILLRKARLRHLDLPVEAAELIANHVQSNTREIEGALARLVNEASVRKCPLSLEAARAILSDLPNEDTSFGSVTVPQILRSIQDYYQLKPRDLLSRSKVRSIVLPRQVGMFLARQLTQLSLAEIGLHFGGRDHTTVLYALERIESLCVVNPQLRVELQVLRERILSSRAFRG